MYNNERDYLAKTLRKLRIEAGFTQQNLADILNINRSTYTYYESGKTTPDIRSLKQIAAVLGVNIEIFLESEPLSPTLNDYENRRPAKKIRNNPQHVGELSSKEKKLIALIRANKSKMDDTLEFLRPGASHLEPDEADDDDYTDISNYFE